MKSLIDYFYELPTKLKLLAKGNCKLPNLYKFPKHNYFSLKNRLCDDKHFSINRSRIKYDFDLTAVKNHIFN